MALSAASVVNRLRLVETIFSIFDLDNDGKVTKDEMGKMLHTLVDVTNSNRKRRHHHFNGHDHNKQINLQKRIDDAFNELNTNDDDHITKDEFIEWYIKSGLLSDKSNEINVPNTSRIYQLDKKSRKMKKQQLNGNHNNRKEENQHPPLARYKSYMTEQKPAPTILDENEIIDDDHLKIRVRIDSEDNDSHSSKENERWQHLFNSVLGQIRAQRAQESEQQESDPNRISHFNSWKQQGEDKIKKEYYKQKSIDQSTSSSSDVVTIRL
jgi:hypothetical protein